MFDVSIFRISSNLSLGQSLSDLGYPTGPNKENKGWNGQKHIRASVNKTSKVQLKVKSDLNFLRT